MNQNQDFQTLDRIVETMDCMPLQVERHRDGKPCGHPGCLNHVSHPCEGCGRVAGRYLRQTSSANSVNRCEDDRHATE